MKKNLLIWSALVICIAFTACYDDKGNYNYHEINDITISGIPESFSLIFGETIDIIPEIEVSTPGKDPMTFEYTWYVLGGKNSNLVQLADTRDLVNWQPPFSSGTNMIVLYVHDPATGQTAISNTVSIITENSIGKGFAILSEHDNMGEFDYLTLYKEEWLRVKATDLPELPDPVGVWGFSDKNSPFLGASSSGTVASADQFCLFIGTRNKLYRLYTKDLSYDPKYDYYEMVLGPQKDPDFAIAKAIHAPTGHEAVMLSFEGNYYYYSTGSQVWRLVIPDGYINCDLDGTVFPVSPYMENYGADRRRILFRTDTRSFVFHAQGAHYCSAYTDSEDEEVVLNNTGRDLLWMGGRHREGAGVIGKTYAVMKDAASGSKRYIVSFLQDGITRSEYDISALTDIALAVGYEIPRHERGGTNPLFYYQTDTKVYVYNMEHGFHTLVYTAPAGRTISWFGRAGTKYMSGSNYWDDNLIICTYDPSNPVGSGTMELWKPTDITGELTRATNGDEGGEMTFAGFNKIISVAWKGQ